VSMLDPLMDTQGIAARIEELERHILDLERAHIDVSFAVEVGREYIPMDFVTRGSVGGTTGAAVSNFNEFNDIGSDPLQDLRAFGRKPNGKTLILTFVEDCASLTPSAAPTIDSTINLSNTRLLTSFESGSLRMSVYSFKIGTNSLTRFDWTRNTPSGTTARTSWYSFVSYDALRVTTTKSASGGASSLSVSLNSTDPDLYTASVIFVKEFTEEDFPTTLVHAVEPLERQVDLHGEVSPGVGYFGENNAFVGAWAGGGVKVRERWEGTAVASLMVGMLLR
jgi:hypothetical protein